MSLSSMYKDTRGYIRDFLEDFDRENLEVFDASEHDLNTVRFTDPARCPDVTLCKFIYITVRQNSRQYAVLRAYDDYIPNPLKISPLFFTPTMQIPAGLQFENHRQPILRLKLNDSPTCVLFRRAIEHIERRARQAVRDTEGSDDYSFESGIEVQNGFPVFKCTIDKDRLCHTRIWNKTGEYFVCNDDRATLDLLRKVALPGSRAQCLISAVKLLRRNSNQQAPVYCVYYRCCFLNTYNKTGPAGHSIR